MAAAAAMRKSALSVLGACLVVVVVVVAAEAEAARSPYKGQTFQGKRGLLMAAMLCSPGLHGFS